MNSKTYSLIISVLILILIGIIVFWLFIARVPQNNTEDLLLKKINELELKIDSLNNKKDSIRMVIDSTHVKIITNEKHYQERINTIINQSASSDSEFITDYIRLYTEQNPWIDFSGTREIKY